MDEGTQTHIGQQVQHFAAKMGISVDEAYRLLQRGLVRWDHDGAPPKIWQDKARQRVQRLEDARMRRKGDVA